MRSPNPIAPWLVAAATCACGAPETGPRTPASPLDLAPGPESAAPGFEPLVEGGVRGGRHVAILPGTVDQVLAALFDFERAAGHRSWAESFVPLTLGEDAAAPSAVVRWNFRGKLGVRPSVTVEQDTQRTGDGAIVRFRLIDPAFGLRAFSGDIELYPAPGRPEATLFTQRVFISSGLGFVDASHADIRDGLLEDARLLTEWLPIRLSGKPASSPGP